MSNFAKTTFYGAGLMGAGGIVWKLIREREKWAEMVQECVARLKDLIDPGAPDVGTPEEHIKVAKRHVKKAQAYLEKKGKNVPYKYEEVKNSIKGKHDTTTRAVMWAIACVATGAAAAQAAGVNPENLWPYIKDLAPWVVAVMAFMNAPAILGMLYKVFQRGGKPPGGGGGGGGDGGDTPENGGENSPESSPNSFVQGVLDGIEDRDIDIRPNREATQLVEGTVGVSLASFLRKMDNHPNDGLTGSLASDLAMYFDAVGGPKEVIDKVFGAAGSHIVKMIGRVQQVIDMAIAAQVELTMNGGVAGIIMQMILETNAVDSVRGFLAQHKMAILVLALIVVIAATLAFTGGTGTVPSVSAMLSNTALGSYIASIGISLGGKKMLIRYGRKILSRGGAGVRMA